jgi:multiple sugar transport system substrate-binding protein
MDTPAAIAAFVSGEGGIYPTGTWMIGSFEKEATTPGRPLYQSYAVFPYPRLWGEHVEFVSGHAWVVPARSAAPSSATPSPASSKFMAAHNYDWARTGHIPAFKAVLDDPRFKALPHRADIAPLAIDRPAAAELRAAPECDRGHGRRGDGGGFTGQKPVEQALADAERRVNELLSLYRAMRERGWRKADLARAMSLNPRQIDRLLDLRHSSTVTQLDRALTVCGKRVELDLRELGAAA